MNNRVRHHVIHGHSQKPSIILSKSKSCNFHTSLSFFSKFGEKKILKILENLGGQKNLGVNDQIIDRNGSIIIPKNWVLNEGLNVVDTCHQMFFTWKFFCTKFNIPTIIWYNLL